MHDWVACRMTTDESSSWDAAITMVPCDKLVVAQQWELDNWLVAWGREHFNALKRLRINALLFLCTQDAQDMKRVDRTYFPSGQLLLFYISYSRNKNCLIKLQLQLIVRDTI